MTAVESWLDSLGLRIYADMFARADVELDLVPGLSDVDLKELGVASLGHRKRILAAAKRLKDQDALIQDIASGTTAPTEHARETDDQPQATPSPAISSIGFEHSDGERRQLTVMSCDIANALAMGTRSDPEDLQHLVSVFQSVVGEVISRHTGYVAQFQSGGALIYFGWPEAHEDDCERAIRAAIDVVESLNGAGSSASLDVRIAIATGIVVVGRADHGLGGGPDVAVGEAPNLAARLLDLANANEIVIAATSHRLVGRAFQYADLGAQFVEGFSAPLRAYKVLGLGHVGGRFQATRATALTPFVGRQSEIGILHQRWEMAREGDGQLVTIAGEPGIGKSRIIEQLRADIDDESHLVEQYQCSPNRTDTPLHPFIDSIVRGARLEHEESPHVAITKLERFVKGVGLPPKVTLPVVAGSLGLADEIGGAAAGAGRMKSLRQALTDAMVQRGLDIAAKTPLLLVIEDAHWIDPSTEETVGRFIEHARDARVMIVITFRPEYRGRLTDFDHATRLVIGRLGRRHASGLLRHVCGERPLPEVVSQQIVARADGIPLYVEELVRTVLDSDLLTERNGALELAGPLPEFAIPTTLQDSLMARLDRLAPVKDLVQIGACIGRRFSYDLLAAVAPLHGEALDDALAQITDSGLIFESGAPPDSSYTFRHTLVQEAAYDSLLTSRRQQIHATIARAIEQKSGHILDGEPELVAQHYAAAGLPDRAVPYWLRAGELATERSANVEAIRHLKRGLALLEALPVSEERDRLELRLQTALSTPLIVAKGFAADDTARAQTRARALTDKLQDTRLSFPALYGQCVFHTVRSEHRRGQDVAREFLDLANAKGEAGSRLVGHRIMGLTDIYLGAPASAVRHLEKALSLHDPDAHGGMAFHYAQDPKVATLALLSWAYWLVGRFSDSIGASTEALAGARAMGHSHTLAYALFHAGILPNYLRRDVDSVEKCARELVDVCDQDDIVTWRPFGQAALGWIDILRGEANEGIAQVQQVLTARQVTTATFNSTFLHALIAEGYTQTDRPDRALKTLDAARAFTADTAEGWLRSELARMTADALRLLPDTTLSDVEQKLCHAVDTAYKQDAYAFALRAVAALAEHWHDRDDDQRAADLLRPIVARFGEERTLTEDLRHARSLLDQLRR